MKTKAIAISSLPQTVADIKTVELKSIRSARGEETPRFSATLVVNGIPVCHTGNGGTGGCNDYDPINMEGVAVWRHMEPLLEAYAKTLPPHVYGEHTIEQDLDSIVFDLLDKQEGGKAERRSYTNKCKTKLVYVDDKTPKGKYNVISLPNGLRTDPSKIPAAILKAQKERGEFSDNPVFANLDMDAFLKRLNEGQ